MLRRTDDDGLEFVLAAGGGVQPGKRKLIEWNERATLQAQRFIESIRANRSHRYQLCSRNNFCRDNPSMLRIVNGSVNAT